MTNQNNESVADEIIGVTMDTELSLPQMTKRIVGILEQQLTAANQQIEALSRIPGPPTLRHAIDALLADATKGKEQA
jgi:hypothetical protein